MVATPPGTRPHLAAKNDRPCFPAGSVAALAPATSALAHAMAQVQFNWEGRGRGSERAEWYVFFIYYFSDYYLFMIFSVGRLDFRFFYLFFYDGGGSAVR